MHPLHAAIRAGDRGAITAHFEAGGDMLALDPASGRSALHAVAEYGSQADVLQLILAGAPVNFRDHERRTPAHLAAPREDPAILRTLLEAGANAQTRDARGCWVVDLVESPARVAGLLPYRRFGR